MRIVPLSLKQFFHYNIKERMKKDPADIGACSCVAGLGMIQQERQNNIINILGGHSYAM
jgi:hypothetical protein